MDKVFTRIQAEKLQEEFDNAVELLESANIQLKQKDEAITKLQETITALTQENNQLKEKLNADFNVEEYEAAISTKVELEKQISDLTVALQSMEESVKDFDKKVNVAVLEKLASQGVSPVEVELTEDGNFEKQDMSTNKVKITTYRNRK